MNAPGRLLLCLLSVAAIVWLAFSLSDMRALDRAAAASRPGAAPGPATIAARIRDTKRAGRLRPGDTEPLIARGRLYLLAGRADAARAVLEDVVRQEPRNAHAWVLLTVSTFRTDLRRAREAVRHVRELDPRGSARRG